MGHGADFHSWASSLLYPAIMAVVWTHFTYVEARGHVSFKMEGSRRVKTHSSFPAGAIMVQSDENVTIMLGRDWWTRDPV